MSNPMDDEFKKMMEAMIGKVDLPEPPIAKKKGENPKPKIVRDKKNPRVTHFFEGGEDHKERPEDRIIRAKNGKDVSDMLECLESWKEMAMTGEVRSITIIGVKGDSDDPGEFQQESENHGRYLAMSNTGRGSQFSIGDIISAVEEGLDRLKRQATLTLARAIVEGAFDEMPEAERPPMTKVQAQALIQLAELEEKLRRKTNGQEDGGDED